MGVAGHGAKLGHAVRCTGERGRCVERASDWAGQARKEEKKGLGQNLGLG